MRKGKGCLVVLGVMGGLLALWRFGINRSVAIDPALVADQRTVVSDVAGVLTYYVDTSATGRPLVLIHSVNAAASSFEMKPLFDHYRGSRPVYALDLPGFGFSERSDREYTIEMYVTAIETLLQEVVGEPADVVALSLGSEFAAAAAVRNPALVHSLTLLSPSGLRNYDGRPPETALTLGSVPGLGQLIYDGLTSRRGLSFFLNMNFEGEINQAVLDYAFDTSHQPGARYAPFYFVGGRLFNYDVTDSVYLAVEVPTLVIYDQDPNVTFDRLNEVLEKNDNWQADRIAPTRGLPHWEALEATVAALDRFWTANQRVSN